MLSSMFIWLQVLGIGFGVSMVCGILASLAIIITFCLFVAVLVEGQENPFVKQKESYPYYDDWKKARYAFLIMRKTALIAIFPILLMCVVPSQKTALTYIALREVDKYNLTVEDSNLNPQKVLGVADGIVDTITDVGDIVSNFLNPEE